MERADPGIREAAALHAEIRARHDAHGVTASIGVVGLAPGADPAATLARADAAMYQAKKANGNTAIVADDPTGSHPRHR